MSSPTKRARPQPDDDTFTSAINRFARDCKFFGLILKSDNWRQEKNRNRSKTPEDICLLKLHPIFYSNPEGFHECLQTFQARYSVDPYGNNIEEFSKLVETYYKASPAAKRRLTFHTLDSDSDQSLLSTDLSRTPSFGIGRSEDATTKQQNQLYPTIENGQNTSFDTVDTVSSESTKNSTKQSTPNSSPKDTDSEASQHITDNAEPTVHIPPIAAPTTTAPGQREGNARVTLPVDSMETNQDTTMSNGDNHPQDDRMELEGSKALLFPSREDWRVRDLPRHRLFTDAFPNFLLSCSHRVRFEITRLSLELDVPLAKLQDARLDRLEDYNYLWKMFERLARNDSKPPRTSPTNWEKALSKDSTLIQKGYLNFGKQTDKTIFKISLSPLESSQESFRFARKFGAHRFLRIELPQLRMSPTHFSASEGALRRRLESWLATPAKDLMGYFWNVLFARSSTSRRPRKKSDYAEEDEQPGHEVFLFATSGPGLENLTIEQVVNWFIPLHQNLNMSYCKAFARIELGFSRTYATFQFRPDQIRWVDDILADGTPENSEFDDKSLFWPNLHNKQNPRVMNDGCSLISYGAAKRVWEHLNQEKPVPSCFQARIGPCKGIWIVCEGPSQYDDASSEEIWIEVNKSQKKFNPHEEDLKDETYDNNRLMFEVNDWPREASESRLHIDFIRPLADRGVGRPVLENRIMRALNDLKDNCKAVKENVYTLYKFADKNSFEPTGGKLIEWEAFPKSYGLRACEMLKAGFDPWSFGYLQKSINFLIDREFAYLREKLKISLPHSTNVFGIADPLGILKPNEIHLGFSRSFGDKRYHSLHQREVLVARQPCLRRSDIQKVKATFKNELRHLQDVVVFPSKGQYPLAGKLQGGDYDGDRFWVCWEPDLVQTFRNAPPPINTPPPEVYGISTDATKLISFYDEVAHKFNFSDFMKRSLSFVCLPSFLGICTRKHELLTYLKGNISSPGVDALADIHDYLIDSSKNGYKFGELEWSQFLQSHYDIDVKQLGQLQEPPYKRTTTFSDDQLSKISLSPNSSDILDYLVLGIALKRGKDIVEVCKIPSVADQDLKMDVDVTALYVKERESKDPAIQSCVLSLERRLVNIYKNKWARFFSASHEKTGKKYNEARDRMLDECRALYNGLRPDLLMQPDHDINTNWHRRIGKVDPTYWECLRASTLFFLYCRKSPEFVFTLAGHDICSLKSLAGAPDVVDLEKPDYVRGQTSFHSFPRLIRSDFWTRMKMKKIKSIDSSLDIDSREYEDEELEEVDTFYDMYDVDMADTAAITANSFASRSSNEAITNSRVGELSREDILDLEFVLDAEEDMDTQMPYVEAREYTEEDFDELEDNNDATQFYDVPEHFHSDHDNPEYVRVDYNFSDAFENLKDMFASSSLNNYC